jgi:hypothetical protein
MIEFSTLSAQAAGLDASHVPSMEDGPVFSGQSGSRILGSMSSRSGVVRRELKGEVKVEILVVLVSVTELLGASQLKLEGGHGYSQNGKLACFGPGRNVWIAVVGYSGESAVCNC